MQTLPDELLDAYKPYVIPDENCEEYKIMKSADKISAYIKCVEEIKAGKELLSTLGFYNKGSIQVVSCPTCGRTEIDLISIVNEVEEKCKNIDKDIKVAVMGCVVNGPGEAREADLGIAGGKGVGLVFKKGEVIRKVNEDELVSALMEEIEKA